MPTNTSQKPIVFKGTSRRRLSQNLSMLKDKCNNPKNPMYPYYGGRGIKCLISSVQELQDILGDKPTEQHSIDRIDNEGHYEAGNLRWATKSQQAFNSRPRKNNPVGIAGVTQKGNGKWSATHKKKCLYEGPSFVNALACKLLALEKDL